MNPKHIQTIPIHAAIITVSSTRTKENDTSGKTICDILTSARIQIEHYSIVGDRIEAIRSEIFLALKKSNCVILNGGTGLTHDDCTIEAVLPLLDKKIDGFGELFRMKAIRKLALLQCFPAHWLALVMAKQSFAFLAQPLPSPLVQRNLLFLRSRTFYRMQINDFIIVYHFPYHIRKKF